jgi:hypothetical protein
VSTDLVLYTGQVRGSDSFVWHTAFTLHTTGCRYAAKAEPAALGAALDLYGRTWFRKMLADGTVKRCKVCKPNTEDL